MYKAHHWALYHMWFQNKSDLYDISLYILLYDGKSVGMDACHTENSHNIACLVDLITRFGDNFDEP